MYTVTDVDGDLPVKSPLFLHIFVRSDVSSF